MQEMASALSLGAPADLACYCVAAIAPLSSAGIVVALGAHGPITNNAGGTSEMTNMPPGVRSVTGPLNAVSNAT